MPDHLTVPQLRALVKKGDFYDIAIYLRQFMPDELHTVLYDFIAGRLVHSDLEAYLNKADSLED